MSFVAAARGQQASEHLGKTPATLGDDHSHMGGSDDMKSGIVIVEIVGIW